MKKLKSSAKSPLKSSIANSTSVESPAVKSTLVASPNKFALERSSGVAVDVVEPASHLSPNAGDALNPFDTQQLLLATQQSSGDDVPAFPTNSASSSSSGKSAFAKSSSVNFASVKSSTAKSSSAMSSSGKSASAKPSSVKPSSAESSSGKSFSGKSTSHKLLAAAKPASGKASAGNPTPAKSSSKKSVSTKSFGKTSFNEDLNHDSDMEELFPSETLAGVADNVTLDDANESNKTKFAKSVNFSKSSAAASSKRMSSKSAKFAKKKPASSKAVKPVQKKPINSVRKNLDKKPAVKKSPPQAAANKGLPPDAETTESDQVKNMSKKKELYSKWVAAKNRSSVREGRFVSSPMLVSPSASVASSASMMGTQQSPRASARRKPSPFAMTQLKQAKAVGNVPSGYMGQQMKNRPLGTFNTGKDTRDKLLWEASRFGGIFVWMMKSNCQEQPFMQPTINALNTFDTLKSRFGVVSVVPRRALTGESLKQKPGSVHDWKQIMMQPPSSVILGDGTPACVKDFAEWFNSEENKKMYQYKPRDIKIYKNLTHSPPRAADALLTDQEVLNLLQYLHPHMDMEEIYYLDNHILELFWTSVERGNLEMGKLLPSSTEDYTFLPDNSLVQAPIAESPDVVVSSKRGLRIEAPDAVVSGQLDEYDDMPDLIDLGYPAVPSADDIPIKQEDVDTEDEDEGEEGGQKAIQDEDFVYSSSDDDAEEEALEADKGESSDAESDMFDCNDDNDSDAAEEDVDMDRAAREELGTQSEHDDSD